MRIPKVYFDTSVIGGCFDDEFKLWSDALFEDLKKEKIKAVTSFLVAAEIADAPEVVKEKYRQLLNCNTEIINQNGNSSLLLDSYLKHNILSQRFIDDMNHIAIATLACVDMLVSWNFKHIVRYDKIRLFNAVNIENGYKTIEIFSPREVTCYGKEI
jgi:predicted nucleic acid-binding protein